MSSEWTFNEERPGENQQVNGQSSRTGNAELREQIEDLYKELLQWNYSYEQLYDMTIYELVETIKALRKGFAYRIWKQAYLTGWAATGKHFPKSPELASPELYYQEKKKTIAMPENLLKQRLKQIGGKINE